MPELTAEMALEIAEKIESSTRHLSMRHKMHQIIARALIEQRIAAHEGDARHHCQGCAAQVGYVSDVQGYMGLYHVDGFADCRSRYEQRRIAELKAELEKLK